MSEGLLRARLAARGSSLTVASRGLLPGGIPVAGEVVGVLARRGVDLSGHVSCQLDHASLDRARLVVTMTRQQLVTVSTDCPQAFPCSFQLVDLARRAARQGARLGGEPLEEWVARLHAGRRLAGLLSLDPSDDIADPMGGRRRAYEHTADSLEALLDSLADALAGPVAVEA